FAFGALAQKSPRLDVPGRPQSGTETTESGTDWGSTTGRRKSTLGGFGAGYESKPGRASGRQPKTPARLSRGECAAGTRSSLLEFEGRGSSIPGNRGGPRYFVRGRFSFAGAVSDAFSTCGGAMVMYVVSRYSSE